MSGPHLLLQHSSLEIGGSNRRAGWKVIGQQQNQERPCFNMRKVRNTHTRIHHHSTYMGHISSAKPINKLYFLSAIHRLIFT